MTVSLITPKGVHQNTELTNMVQAYTVDEMEYIQDAVIPTVPNTKLTDFYYIFDKKKMFRNQVKQINPARIAPPMNIAFDTATFGCLTRGTSWELATQTDENADVTLKRIISNATQPYQQCKLDKEIIAANKLFTYTNWGSNYASLVVGQKFDEAGVDAYTYIKSKIKMASKGGRWPNRVTMGIDVWMALQTNASLLGKYENVIAGVITEEMFKSLFKIKHLHIGTAKYNADVESETDTETMTDIWGPHMAIYYAPENPDVSNPSAVYRFQHKPIAMYNYPEHKSMVYESYYVEDVKITGTDLGFLIKDAVTAV